MPAPLLQLPTLGEEIFGGRKYREFRELASNSQNSCKKIEFSKFEIPKGKWKISKGVCT